MAEAAVLDPETTPQLPPEEHEDPPKRRFGGPQPGAGRPSKEKLEKASEHDAQSYADLQAGLTEADWERHIIYCWRLDPWYDNTNGGRDVKYIGVFTTPVSEESLKKEYGSGSYKIQLNKGDKLVATVRYSILDEKFPPALPPGDWLDHPRNKKWQPWRPLIEARFKAKVAEQTATPGTGDSATVDTLTKMIQRLVERETGKPAQTSENEKLTSTLVTWALNQTSEQRKVEREGDSPSKIVDMMGAMIKAMKELAPAPVVAPPKAEGLDPTLNIILTNLREDLKAARDEAKAEREANRKLTEKILEAKGEQTNPLSQLEMFGNIIARFGEITGKVGGGPRGWQEVIADAVTEVAPKLVDMGNTYITQKAISDRQKAQQQPPKPGAPATPPATTAPQLAAPSTAAPATPAPATPDPAAPAPTPDQPPATEMDVNERTQLVYVAMMAAQALNLGLKGDQFAEQICVKHGDQALEDFVSHFEKATMIEKVKAIPEAWESLAPHEARLQRFIDDFYSFAEAPDDEEPEPAPAAAPAKKPAAKPAAKGKKK